MAKRKLVAGRFMLGRRIGKGSFGEVFSGCELASDTQIAIKTEPVKSPHSVLLAEAKVLKELGGLEGVPNVHWSGSDGQYHYLVMDLLGKNLERLQKKCKGRLSLQTVAGIGKQLITRLEAVHARGYLHKDIKPANCAMGLSNPQVFYLLDFGLAKKYVDLRTKTHIAYREGKGLIGTARYASVNVHMGLEQSRRDDLESGFYMLLFMLEGGLPWQGLPSQGQLDKSHKIAEMKMGLALGKTVPVEFQQMLAYIHRLKFEEKPDYSYLRHLLHTLSLRYSLPTSPHFDWDKKQRSRANSTHFSPIQVFLSPTPSPRQAEDSSSMQPYCLVDPSASLDPSTPLDRELTLTRRWPRLSPAARLAIQRSQSPKRLPSDQLCCVF